MDGKTGVHGAVSGNHQTYSLFKLWCLADEETYADGLLSFLALIHGQVLKGGTSKLSNDQNEYRISIIQMLQNLVYGLTALLGYLIPDVPSAVKTQIQREKLLQREVLFETELQEEGGQEDGKSNKAFLATIDDDNFVTEEPKMLSNPSVESF